MDHTLYRDIYQLIFLQQESLKFLQQCVRAFLFIDIRTVSPYIYSAGRFFIAYIVPVVPIINPNNSQGYLDE